MMKRDSDNTDELLRRSLTEALDQGPLRDEEIEALSDGAGTTADDAGLARILRRTRELIQQNDRPVGGRLAGFLEPTQASSDTSEITMQQLDSTQSRHFRNPRGAVAALMVSAMALMAVLLWTSRESMREKAIVAEHKAQEQNHLLSLQQQWMTARYLPQSKPARVGVGDTIQTGARERRRVGLPDGSVLYVNEQTRARVTSARRVDVAKGEIYVEVAPSFDEGHRRDRFQIVTPTRTVTALGTRFGVDASDDDAEVLVTQGKVKVSGVAETIDAGQHLVAMRETRNSRLVPIASARASEHLNWTRDLMNAAGGAIVPESEYAGGAIISVDPDGQKLKLSLRKYHVDVHIEDGFARTTIDQTYFNHTQSRLEGTFHFPLPSDASLSRLAMYVNGKLMEGGMAERQHARNTFEKIVHKMKDPALLEWVDGSTFKMRVFPLEARQEKRIILSYTQRLNTAYGKTYYRFPAGHSMDIVGEWSTRLRISDGKQEEWTSPSHKLDSSLEDNDLILTGSEKRSRMNRDLVIEIGKGSARNTPNTAAAEKWSTAMHEGQQYLMLRYRPDLPGQPKREPRHWVFLFEASADRNPVLARTQIGIIRTLLENAEHTDTFNIVTANTTTNVFGKSAVKCTARNIRKAMQHLGQTHLIGALDLESGLRQCQVLCDSERETVVVHTGSAIPVLGSHDQSVLLSRIPQNAAYVGVGVGRNWSRPFMKAAAGRSGGYFCQINPDEEVSWRSFELSALLNTPRLLNIQVAAVADNQPAAAGSGSDLPTETSFLNFADTIAQGEEICAVARMPAGKTLPKSVTVTGLLNGRRWQKQIRVTRVSDTAEYLPRSWAKLRIDRLVADSAAEHRSEIIRLSKAMYVMSPFTSLLVLENEQMYTQYNIDRGRKDHWALYDCPQQIKVVHEPLNRTSSSPAISATNEEQPTHWLSTIRSLPTPVLTSAPGFLIPVSAGVPVEGWRADKAARWYADKNQTLAESRGLTPRYVIDAVNDGFQWNYQVPTDVNQNSVFDSGVTSSMFGVAVDGNRFNSGLGLLDDGYVRQSFRLRSSVVRRSDPLILPVRPSRNAMDMSAPQNVEQLVEQLQQGQQRSAVASDSLSLRGEIDVKAMRDLGILILKGDAADVARVESTIRELDSLQRSGFEVEALNSELHTLQENEIKLRMAIPPIPELSVSLDTIRLPEQWAADTSHLSWDRNSVWIKDSSLAAVAPSIPLFEDFDRDGLVDDIHFDFASPYAGSAFPVRPEFLGEETLSYFGNAGIRNWSANSGINPAYGAYPYYAVQGATQFFDLNSAGGYGYSMSSPSVSSGNSSNAAVRSLRSGFAGNGDKFRAYVVPPLQIMREPGPMISGPGFGEITLGPASYEMGFRMNAYPQVPLGWAQATLSRDAWVLFPGPGQGDAQVLAQRARPELLIRELQEELITKKRSLEQKQSSVRQSVVGHRWAKATQPETDRPFVQLPVFSYTIPPYFGSDRRYFGDLMSHAPGLNTWTADILAMAAERRPAEAASRTGKIDKGAERLINRCRSLGWEKITFDNGRDQSSFSLVCDGHGAHVYERQVSEGLTEEVTCDGRTLIHAYRDIGLASQRTWSRFHRRSIESVVPWLVPPAEELSRGASVVALDKNTVAIIPLSDPAQQSDTGEESKASSDNVKAAVVTVETHLIFGDDGRLTERRLVNGESGDTLLRTIFDANGRVRVLSGSDKLITEFILRREPVSAPDLKPDLDQLVVLPMPVRSSESILGDREESEIAGMKKSDLLRLVLADSAEQNGTRVVKTIEKHFLNKGDTREGLYLLLSRFPNLLQHDAKVPGTDGLRRETDLRPSADRSPLLQFVRQYISWQLDQQQGLPNFEVEGASSGFVQRMATACNIYHRWNSGTAVNDRTKKQVKRELNAALKFVSTCRTDAMGWTLMNAIQPKLKSPALSGLFAAAVERFEQNPELAVFAREARVRALFEAGEHQNARQLYAELLRASLLSGRLPRISPEYRQRFVDSGGASDWSDLMTKIGEQLFKAELPYATFMFSVQLRQLGDTENADALLEMIVAGLDAKQRPDVALLAAEQLRLLADGQANELLAAVQESGFLQKSAAFWRYAASVADALGKKQTALDRIEKAIQLEFNNRPDVVNVERLRADYADLFRRFEEIVAASATLETELPHDLFARIIRAADQWRSLEDDATTCCQTTARLLTKLNRPELSWRYLTTPLAGRSGESAPWQQLAEYLGRQNQVDLADVAWSTAFEFEQTNPEILYGHAMMLKNNGRAADSRTLLKKIVNSSWQPRFNSTRQNADSQLKQLAR